MDKFSYPTLTKALQTSANQGLLPDGRKNVFFFSDNHEEIYLIFYSNNPASEPNNPIDGWQILEEVPDPKGIGLTIIVCYVPPCGVINW